MKNLKLLGDRILVQRIKNDTVKKGILIIQNKEQKQDTALVIKVGQGKKDKEGNFIPLPVKEQDKILMEKYAGQVVTLNEEEYVILRADDIIAIYLEQQ